MTNETNEAFQEFIRCLVAAMEHTDMTFDAAANDLIDALQNEPITERKTQ